MISALLIILGLIFILVSIVLHINIGTSKYAKVCFNSSVIALILGILLIIIAIII